MAFIIAQNLTTMSIIGGEPMFFSYQPCRADTAFTPEPDIARSRYGFSIYVPGEETSEDHFGEDAVGPNGHTKYWLLDGKVSLAHQNRANLMYELFKVKNNGKEVHARGRLIIEKGSPAYYDDDNASYSTHINQIRRLNNPADYNDARFSVTMEEFEGEPTPTEPPVTRQPSPFDLSTGDNMLAFAAF